VPESEPGLLTAGLVAGDRAGWAVDGIALREAERQTQIHWRKKGAGDPAVRTFEDLGRISEAARAFLAQRGEPAPLLPVLGAVFLHAGVETGGEAVEMAPDDGYAQLTAALEEALTYRAGFLRYNAGKELDTGQWWLRDETGAPTLADRVELAASRYLADHPDAAFMEIDVALCSEFPGLDTPDIDLITACIDSYGVRDGEGWRLRPEDDPVSRKNEQSHNRSLLIRLGERLGFEVDPGPPLTWSDAVGRYLFHITTTATFGDLLQIEGAVPARRVVLVPGSRANLLLFKRRRDPRLDHLLNEWKFVKFRHLRALSANTMITRENIDDQMTADQLTYEAAQLNLF
jgi:hypothetical protein